MRFITAVSLFTLLSVIGCVHEPVGTVGARDFTRIPPDTPLRSLSDDERVTICQDFDAASLTASGRIVCDVVAAIETVEAGGDRQRCLDARAGCVDDIYFDREARCRAGLAPAWAQCSATIDDLYACNAARGRALDLLALDFDCDHVASMTADDIAAFRQRADAADAEAECAPFIEACGLPGPTRDSVAAPVAEAPRSWRTVVVTGRPGLPEGAGICAVHSTCGAAVSVGVDFGDTGCAPDERCDPGILFEPDACDDDPVRSLAAGTNQTVTLDFDADLAGCTIEVVTIGAEGVDGPGYGLALCAGADECVAVEHSSADGGTLTFRLPTP